MVKRSQPQQEALTTFLELSRILTGVNGLAADLGRQYLNRLSSSTFAPSLQQVLERFRSLGKHPNPDKFKQHILSDATLRPTICQIILLWYTSGMQDPSDPATPFTIHYGTQEEYFSGLGWQLIGAHVPGLSGGYFGHWRYRPENEPEEAGD
jgi:D-sorbitol dehydrogenase-like protein